jgi:hypothetical protein
MSKHNKQARVATPTSTPAPATPVEVQVAPATPAPVEVQATPAPVTKPVKAKYAPASAVNNPAAVITVLVPNAKGFSPTNKSATRFNKYYVPGITVAEFIAAYKAANERVGFAQADLRWDLQHGFIALEVPAEKA